MRTVLRAAMWWSVFLASFRAPAAEPAPLADGGYRFRAPGYEATVDRHGRIASLRVDGQEMLSPRSVNAKGYGASLVGGPDHRTLLDLPKVALESGAVVARGDGREVRYRFRPDGIDFLFDLREQAHWVLYLNRAAITHLARPDGQVATLAEGGPMAAARAAEKAALRLDPPLFVHVPWVGKPGADDLVIAGYCNVGPGKAEAGLRVAPHSGWVHQIQVLSIKPSCADHLFPRGQPVRFEVALKNHHGKPFEGRLVFEVEDHAGFAGPQRFELPVRLGPAASTTLTWQHQPAAPRVAKAVMRLVAGEETVTSRDMVFVYDAENYRPVLTRPEDFAAFWQTTLAEMRARPLDLKVTVSPELSNARKTVSLVSFTGLGGRRIEGWLEEPAAQGKYAASFGARVQNYQWPKPAPNDATDTVHLVMKLYRDGIYNSGMETRETAEFRHVYADYVRCVDVLVAHGKVDPKRIVATGASRTGPAALAAAALDHRIALVDIHVPTSAGISWSTRFYRGWGSHGSAGRPADVPLEKWLRLLAYFDMVNFASDVRCPVIIGLGLRDYDLSPAPGIIAAYALLPGDKALGVSPWEGHCYPEAFQRLQVSYRRKHLAGDRRSGSLPLTSPLRYTCVILGETKFIPLHTECAGCSAMARILITSGPTREHLDPVRYLTNASSGQMGRALTAAALRAGHEAVVVSGPVDVEYPAPAEVLRVVTTQEMLDACRRVFPECDGLIAVAAPCDYRPAKVAAHKIKKTGRGLDLHLVETPDIVAALGASKRPSQWMVAFALETEDPRFRAMQKLERKRCDLIVLNGPAAIHSSRTAAEVIDRQGAVLATLSGPKDEVAEAILRIVGSRLIAKPA